MVKRRGRETNILNNTSFLDTMANTVGALAFILLLVVVVTVAVKLNWLDLEIQTERLPPAVVGEPYEQVLAGVGGNEPYFWRLVEGELPDGLNFLPKVVTTPQGTAPKLFGIPTRPTDPVTLVFQLDDTPVLVGIEELADGTRREIKESKTPVLKRMEIEVQAPPPRIPPLEIVTEAMPMALVDRWYRLDLAARGGVPPFRWSLVQGKLPQGISLDPDLGRVQGTAQVAEQTQFGLMLEDAQSMQATSATLELKTEVVSDADKIIDGIVKKLRITSGKIPNPTIGREYELTLAAEGGISPLDWSIEGELPAGLRFDNGTIRGVPEQAVDDIGFFVTVSSAADAVRPDRDSRQFKVTVDPPPIPVLPLRLF